MKVVILSPHNGEYNNWNIIDESEIPEYISDAPFGSGDYYIIVWPQKIERSVVKKPEVVTEPYELKDTD